jgi:Flp pilus assembly protein CpaB
MTTMQPPAPAAAPVDHSTAQPTRRRPSSRLSAGHLIMIIAAILAVLLNYTVLRARDDTVRVAVAASELQAGQPVTAASFGFVDVRVDDTLLGTLVAPERLTSIEGYIVTATLAPGEIVRRSDLQQPSAPEAQRAMSIPIDPEHAVAGALRPGDRVDVIEVQGRSATYLVTDAEVLDVPAESTGGIGASLRSFSVTIAVDDTTALRLAVAIRSGHLEIVRSTGSSLAETQRLDRDAEEAAVRADTEGEDEGE